ncbi:hypothetical protein BU26DRAFT_89715 [Trematosphaeria pertusa]|uniref:Uncharacterized protein n=1 Tax=Trematosphaeria pertusa TaxID=390896 RepID=A0A6A6I377_9PLEO|nr:uncharacterized protein BU26DRAFT_89715 [Trematosphaeria pertusa]KAF2244945.1 hypothetical protein BU26DRAFT_89715 [Trematosphaeria pertusa]
MPPSSSAMRAWASAPPLRARTLGQSSRMRGGAEASAVVDEGDGATWRLERVRRSCQASETKSWTGETGHDWARRCGPPLTGAEGPPGGGVSLTKRAGCTTAGVGRGRQGGMIGPEVLRCERCAGASSCFRTGAAKSRLRGSSRKPPSIAPLPRPRPRRPPLSDSCLSPWRRAESSQCPSTPGGVRRPHKAIHSGQLKQCLPYSTVRSALRTTGAVIAGKHQP